jgi:uncharacterized protein with von Willebrand factor type A (vWA) domain
MSRDDLLKMLDLAGTGKDTGPTLEIASDERPAPSGPSSLHALDVDAWHVAQGARLAKDNPRLVSLGTTPAEAADFWTAAFRIDPVLSVRCTDPRRLDYCRTLLESPDYKALHETTQLNELASGIAVQSFAEGWANLTAADKRREGRPDRMPAGMAAEVAVMKAAGQALEHAEAEVAQAEEALATFGVGCGKGQASGGHANGQRVAHLFRRVRGNENLRRIVELAGRFRRMAQSKQRAKQAHGFDDMVGVELSGDIGRLLPQELAQLGDELFELDALRRLVERQSFCRQFKGIERIARGPVIVCVDESGSMRSDGKNESAKAFALAMAWVARHQGRWCALNSWADVGHSRTIALPPKDWDETAVMDWCSHFYGGGTAPPLDEMPAIYAATKAPVGKTDVIIVTDGACYLTQEEIDRFLAWKKAAKARLITLVIGCSDNGNMPAVSDEVFRCKSIDVSSEAIGKCLSI